MGEASARRPPGRRRRKLRRTVWTVTIVALVAGGASLWAYLATRPDTYAPGEDHDEITRRLSRNLPAEAPQPRFVDVTAEAGLSGFRTFAGERSSQLPEDMGPGAAWGDFDDDGDDDLFLVSAGAALTADVAQRAPSRLFENRGDGTFAAVESFPDTRIVGMGAAWADYDGDGRLDLVVTGFDTLRLFRNEGGRFVRDERFEERAGFWSGASWADFDRDGDLDLYVCGYVQYVPDAAGASKYSTQYGRKIPHTLNPSSYEPQPNLLFVNRGDGTFDERAREYGVDNPQGRSLAALWYDLDDDGLSDLYVANDISDNVLFLNRKGSFRDGSHSAWVADYRGAMGLTAGDWNRDGDDDLFVTHWVAQENALYDSRRVDDAHVETDEGKSQPLHFVDRADEKGLGQIALRSVGWGTEFADFDADGWLDLFVANGSTLEGEETPRRLIAELPFLLWNEQGRYFHNLAPLSEAFSEPKVSRGLALSDYDLDGDLDVLLMDSGEGVRLLRNDTPQGRWLQVRLRPRGPVLEGARLVGRAGEALLRRTVSGVSYLSQSSRIVHVGLGNAESLDEVEVRWPDGTVQRVGSLAAGARWEIREGEEPPRRTDRAASAALSREQLSEFWRVQRAAMRTMKVDGDLEAAEALFRDALAIDPTHEDSLYYLGNCLAETGEVEEALQRFDELRRLNPNSHRAFKRWGTLRAMTAKTPQELDEAEAALVRAVEINPEATGAQMVLAETGLVRNDLAAAEKRLRIVQGMNPKAADALYLLGYVSWKRGDESGARELLRRAGAGDGKKRAAGAASEEGDVERAMHREATLFGSAFATWSGGDEPREAFAKLETLIARYR